MSRFHVQTFEGPDQVTVRLAGEVDLSCADLLAQALGAALAVGIPVTADCAEVTFLDSSGLRALLEARLLADRTRVGFRLGSVPPVVQRVLDLSGTSELFDTDTDTDPAPSTQQA